jgi:hypothetical protein
MAKTTKQKKDASAGNSTLDLYRARRAAIRKAHDASVARAVARLAETAVPPSTEPPAAPAPPTEE